MVDNSIVAMGRSLVVRFMRYRGSYPAKEYLDILPEKDRARFLASSQLLADEGRLPSTRHGHFLKGAFRDLFELKTSDCRLLGFFHHTCYYLTNGAPKRNPKAQIPDYERAEALREDFLARLSGSKGAHR